jgi:multidrug transporter EmrE-like cation transporter
LSATALSIVLFAAFLHASWNAVVKAAPDRALTLAAVSGVHALAGFVLISISEPPALSSWPSIATSTIIHYGYYALLFHAYRLGDLGQVYPISRGMAPALVALGTFLLIGEKLTGLGWTGLGLVTFGIGLLALQRGAADADRKAIGVAALLGMSTETAVVGLALRCARSTTAGRSSGPGSNFQNQAASDPASSASSRARWFAGMPAMPPKPARLQYDGGITNITSPYDHID